MHYSVNHRSSNISLSLSLAYPTPSYGALRITRILEKNDRMYDIFVPRRAIFKTYVFRNRSRGSIIEEVHKRAAELGEHARGANLYIFNESTQL